jgi:hypothetical protein
MGSKTAVSEHQDYGILAVNATEHSCLASATPYTSYQHCIFNPLLTTSK